MTGLLASVTCVEEARIALNAGADIIDLKDPTRGALGALPVDRIAAIVAAIGHQLPVSATVGDLPPDSELLSQAVRATAAAGVAYVKVGLFRETYFGACIDALALQAASGVRLIAVLFADLKPDLAVLASLADAGFTGAMLDTADKAGGGLRRHLTPEHLARFVRSAKQLGLLTGLAGSLRCEDIEPLLAAEPDYLGFRTALCTGGSRVAVINPEAVIAIRACLPRPATNNTSDWDRSGIPPSERLARSATF